jgi:hypothetical protein
MWYVMANNTKMNISYTIRALDKFTKTHNKLQRQLSNIERMTDSLAGNKEITVDVDNALANKQLSSTKAKLDSIPTIKRVLVHIQGVGKDHQNGMDAIASAMRNFDEIAMGIGTGGLWALLPTLGPMLAVTAGGAGALAAGLLGAATSMGAFAMVAVPTIGYLAEMDAEVERGSKAWYELSDGTRDALTSLDKLRASWGKMQEKFREPVLDIFATNLDTARQALDLFEPTIQGAVDAVGRLSDKLQNSLGSADVKAIFEWLGSTSGKHLEDALTGLGNFGVGFGSLMKAFEPLTSDFMDGFVDMSESFRKWASTLDKNKSFQNFLKFVQDNNGLVLEFIVRLTGLIRALALAFTPVGIEVLKLTNTFMKWATEILNNHKGLGLLLSILVVATGFLRVLFPIVMALVSAFKLVWPVIALVAGWFKKLMPVIIRLFPVVVRIGATILRLATGPIGLLISAVVLMAMVIWKNWDSIWTKTKEIFAKIKDWISTKWDEIQAKWEIIKALYKALKATFGEMSDAVKEKMESMKQKIEDIWNKAQAFLEGIDLMQIGKDIINGLINGIKSIDVKGAVKGIAGDIKSGFTNFFDINSPSRVMKKDVGRWVTLGVLDGMSSMASKAEREATMLANAIARPFESMNKDYQFSAGLGAARSNYATSIATGAGSGASASYGDIVVETPVYLDGREVARGTYRHISTYQDRENTQKSRAKGVPAV